MVAPFLAVSILVPLDQQIIVAGLHLMIFRILIACCWIRILARVARGENLVPGGLGSLDKVFLIWVSWAVTSYVLLWDDAGALVTKLGFLYVALGTYFLLRHCMRDEDDVRRVLRVLASICVGLAILMALEQYTGQSVFAAIGGNGNIEIRAGRVRAQGSFLHPIIAGSCGAFLLPAFIGLVWAVPGSRFYGLAGTVAAIVMIITSSSSTPLAAAVAGGIGLMLWHFRRHLRAIQWSTGCGLFVLHTFVMKAPVWALINRIDLTGSSTSWHRYELVDSFVTRFSEWWLIGTRENAHWGYDMWDTVNWYVASGINGGLAGVLLFVAVLVYGFRAAGRTVRSVHENGRTRRLAWCLGAALFAAAVSFWGIALFDQSILIWYVLLASIVTLTKPRRKYGNA
jgi:hypothetical protein